VAARAIGPVEKVCAPTRHERALVGWLALTIAALVPIPLGVLGLALGAPIGALLTQRGAGVLFTNGACFLLLLVWPLLVLAVVWRDMARLSHRLLLGAKGVALWTPKLSQVVLWDDLGTVWRRVPPAPEDPPSLCVVLERKGARLAITSFFADHHQVALRVLEELERRTRIREEQPSQPGTVSEAITPAERGVSEPGEPAEPGA
jgi:hypothetical protein